ncbi:hypothetical protein [Ralstonia sp. NFACC01]|uniref:hypothetical protein n=1 Tax=Ralstonia sp. NFACC01 TaxID=1566294 RepID=UPI0011143BEF|nr:hypothetical protein [Ralstonia sp. NFACC01]
MTPAFPSSGSSKVPAPQQSVEPVWWEKTVEYLYASREMAQYAFVAPLAGKHEAAGDLVLRDLNARWNLVEFKRAEPDIDSEREKYDCVSDAFKLFVTAFGTGKRNLPHFIVFGHLDEQGTLALQARHYWGRWTGVEIATDRSVPVNAISRFGQTYEHFISYLSILLTLKSRTNSTSASRPEFQSVIGITGNCAIAVPLSDFIDGTPQLAHRLPPESAETVLHSPTQAADTDCAP